MLVRRLCCLQRTDHRCLVPGREPSCGQIFENAAMQGEPVGRSGERSYLLAGSDGLRRPPAAELEPHDRASQGDLRCQIVVGGKRARAGDLIFSLSQASEPGEQVGM